MTATIWASARSGYEIADAVGFGLTPEDLREWAPFYPLEVYWARKHHVDADTARRWAGEGVAIRDSVRATNLGMLPEDVRPWVAAGFPPADAIDAYQARVSLETATRWREVGFILPDALLLIDEGWTLDEAAAARVADSDPTGTRGAGA